MHSFQNALMTCGLMDLAYYQDPTGMREAHLWKLINELIKYEQTSISLGNRMSTNSILFFVDSLLSEDGLIGSNADHQSSAVSAVAVNGVQLMTVHSAKGLEFDHVILLNIGSGFKQSNRNNYFIGETGDKKCNRWSLKVRSDTTDKRIGSSLYDNILDNNKTT